MPRRIKLGVNVDHVATLRQARRIAFPDPVDAAVIAELAGADQITVHLREDRRHIQDRDVRVLRDTVKTKLNLEMGLAADIQVIALKTKPHTITLVPEKREEVTTEGGLDAAREYSRIEPFAQKCRDAGIEVSLFIDPDNRQIDAAKQLGVDTVELHTGKYCEHFGEPLVCAAELRRLLDAEAHAHKAGLRVAAGHGLNYHNIRDYAPRTVHLDEVNIGHALVGHAVFVGFENAVREMIALLAEAVAGRQP